MGCIEMQSAAVSSVSLSIIVATTVLKGPIVVLMLISLSPEDGRHCRRIYALRIHHAIWMSCAVWQKSTGLCYLVGRSHAMNACARALTEVECLLRRPSPWLAD